MNVSPQRGLRVRLLELSERCLETYLARLLLSALIVLSLLPLALFLERAFGLPHHTLSQDSFDLVFFFVFAPEFAVRLIVYLRRRRRGEVHASEGYLLLLDLFATLSFLPVWTFMSQSALPALRLVRLLRMVLLLGYWGGMLSDLLRILTGRERRYQVAFVALLGVVLSFTGAALLKQLGLGVAADGSVIPAPNNDGNFEYTLWWAFRQVQDPGNLLQDLDFASAVVVSVVLTFAGLLLFSFLIGIGTTAIDELLARSRLRPTGLRGHTVVLGLGVHTHFLLEEFVRLYAKNRRRFRAAVLGRHPGGADAIGDELLKWYQFRPGDPVQAADLARVDVARAKRVLILGTGETDPDAEVIATILATRDRNPTVDLYPDMDHAANLMAARTAGGKRTHVIGSGSFLGDYIAQNVVFPGAYRIYRQLLTATGCEIYTYVYLEGERAEMTSGHLDPRAICRRVFSEHGVTLIGFFVADPESGELEIEDLDMVLHPTRPDTSTPAYTEDGRVRRRWLRGLIGITLRWDDLRLAAAAVAVEPPIADGALLTVPPATPGFEGLRLRLPFGRTERVLICGGSARVPRVLTELMKFYGAIDATVLVRQGERVESLVNDLRAALERSIPNWRPEGESGVEERGHDRLLHVNLPRGRARVFITNADWSDTTRIINHPDVEFEKVDVMLFLPSKTASHETDGLVALDLLKVARSARSRETRLSASFRVLGVMNDPTKGDLLEKRLDAMASFRPETTFTIVCGERIRHYFVVQNVFVRGLSQVCLRLLDAGLLGICRLMPSLGDAPLEGTFRFEDLAAHLLEVHQFVLLGIERPGDDGSHHVLLDPQELRDHGPFHWNDVSALFALGDARPLAEPIGTSTGEQTGS